MARPPEFSPHQPSPRHYGPHQHGPPQPHGHQPWPEQPHPTRTHGYQPGPEHSYPPQQDGDQAWPQQAHPQQQYAAQPHAPAAPPRRHLVPIGVGLLVVGTAVGVGVGWLIGGGEPGELSAAEADAAHACAVSRDLESDWDYGATSGSDDPGYMLALSVHELAAAADADADDERYAALLEHAATLHRSIVNFDEPGVNAALGDLSAECDRLEEDA
ncbi:hypothetical protein [Georgenia sp. Z1491]|uniref:hypothetical protein n=1 Tax=Georgenia sp. Z1491 TaxID=3416707 RepID=UPI003CF9D45E